MLESKIVISYLAEAELFSALLSKWRHQGGLQKAFYYRLLSAAAGFGQTPPPILKQGVLLNTFESHPEHLQPPALKRRRVLIRNTPPSTEDLLTQSEHRTPESKSVKAHTLMFRV